MTILKIDVDVKMDEKLLDKFIITRIAILEALGYEFKRISWMETKKGYHFWIEIREKLTDEEMCELQFLLGDDPARCRFNYLRLEAGCFRQFNVLFNKKLKNER
ncbi:MAG: hypothetical protein QW734_07475 [Candidatus Bathyarchaeia archaeon]